MGGPSAAGASEDAGSKPTPEVVGREEELAQIERFVESHVLTSGALVIEGAAGIGKTTLWREALRLLDERTAQQGDRLIGGLVVVARGQCLRQQEDHDDPDRDPVGR